MPGVAEVDAIEATLKASLGGSSKALDQSVAAAAQRLLQQNIEFVPASKPLSLKLSSLKSKYVLLQSGRQDEGKDYSSQNTVSHGRELSEDATMSRSGSSGDARQGESLPSPRVVIYPPEKVRLGWRQLHKVGGGLVNLGNTCYMNSTLQCLTYTAPLVNYCVTEEHPKTCKQQNMCVMCAMRQHIKAALHNSGSAFKPHSILKKLKVIAKHFRHGRQEDAHEFLRYLIDGLQKACHNGHKGLDKFSKDTTVIHQIFGGFLRSQVLCLKCSSRSNTYEPFMDLSLDIKGVASLEGALAKFVKTEPLEAANAYDCKKCGKKTPARKRFSLHKAPNILTLQLNRFNFSRFAGKINKHIQFPEKLDMRPYMSQKQGDPVYYHLYGVLIHAGHHCSMGHYYCYIKAPSNVWYIMNDSTVHTVSISRVLNSEAYLLFYSKAVPSQHHTPAKPPLKTVNSNGMATPKVNGGFSRQNSVTAATPAKASNDVGISVSRQMLSPTKDLKVHPLKTASASSTGDPLFSPTKSPTKSPLLSPFSSHKESPLKTPKSSVMNTSVEPPRKVPNLTDPKGKKGVTSVSPVKPFQGGVKQSDGKAELESRGSGSSSGGRLVMQIKGGKVTTFEKSRDGLSHEVNQSKNSVSLGGGKDSKEQKASDTVERNTSDGGLKRRLNDGEKEKGAKRESKKTATPSSMNSLKREASDKVTEQHKTPRTPSSPAIPATPGSMWSRSNSAPSVNHENDSTPLKTPLKLSIDTPHRALQRTGSGRWCVEDSTPSPILMAGQVKSGKLDADSTDKRPVLSLTKRSSICWSVTDTPSKKTSSLLARSGLVGEGPTPPKRLKQSSSDITELQAKSDVLEGKVGLETKMRRNEESVSKGSGVQGCLEVTHNSTPNVPHRVKDKTQPHSVKDSGKKTTQQNGHSSSDTLLIEQNDAVITPGKHKKKKKKHKQNHDEELTGVNTSALAESANMVDEQSPGRKHKKKRRRNSDLSEAEMDSHATKMCEDSVTDPKRKWHADSTCADPENRQPVKVSRMEHTSQVDPSDEAVQRKVKVSERSSDAAVAVQAWDHYVKDSLVKNLKKDTSKSHKSTLMWDGSKKSQVVEELQKRPAVNTWNGERSEADIEAEKEEKQRNKKTWSDRYNEEIDSGKVKKAKKKKEESPWAFNPFQKYQNHVNNQKLQWSDVGVDTLKRSQSWGHTTTAASFNNSDHSDQGFLAHNGSSDHPGRKQGFSGALSPGLNRSYSLH